MEKGLEKKVEMIKEELSEGKTYQIIYDGIMYKAVKKDGQVYWSEIYDPAKDQKNKGINFSEVINL
jgi:hypothetical protein